MRNISRFLSLTIIALLLIALTAASAQAADSFVTEGVTDGGFPDPLVTLITLNSFTAKAGDAKVTVEWSTASELDNQGFNLWRSTSAAGGPTKINDKLISAKAESVGGADYSLIDTQLKNGTSYYYKLEDIDNKGVSTWHGPVVAVPNFAILPAAPVGAVAKAPAANAAPVGDSPLNAPDPVLPPAFDWSSPGNYDYQVQVSSNPSFPNSAKTVTLPAKSTWTKTKSLTPTVAQQTAIAKLTKAGEPVYVSIIGRDRGGNLNYAPVARFVLPVPLYRRLLAPAAILALLALALAAIKSLIATVRRRRRLLAPSLVGGGK